MDIVIICITAFAASLLTFFSGFGLGTLLTPVFMLFFPVDVAIAWTAIVHFVNNIFKVILVGVHADGEVMIKFGIPAILFAFAGAWLMLVIPGQSTFYSFTFNGHFYEVVVLKFIIALLLLGFAIIEFIPRFKRMSFPEKLMPLGGALSGFFGGLSGNQGALRTAFLIKADLNKEAFIGTTVLISTLVDISRLGVYSSRFADIVVSEGLGIVWYACGAAIAGALLGSKLLKKVTLPFIQTLVALALILLSIAMMTGVL